MPARRVLAPMLLAMSIGLLGGSTSRSETSIALPFAPAAASAQATPEIVVPLYGQSITFRTVPLTAVSAELSDAAGKKKDEGVGVAGDDGTATVQFILGDDPIRPGDVLTLSRSGAKPLRVTVPALSAAADATTERIAGHAPAGAAVALAFTAGGAPGARIVTADAAGGFSADFTGEIDLAAGDVSGTAAFTNAANQRFEVAFASLSADLTLGAYTLRGRANAGANVTAEIRHADGTTRPLGPVATTGDASYVLPLFGQGGPAMGEPPRPLAAGDSVTIRTTGDPVQDEGRVGTLVPLTVTMNPATDQVTGAGPASRALRILCDNMDGQQASLAATSDAGGAFAASTAGQADLGAGWRVRAVVDAGPGVREIAVAVIRKVRIGVRFPGGQGRAEPGQPVTVTLRSAAGTVKFQRPNYVNDQGEYNLFGGGFGGPSPEPGDSVEIAFVDGDPDVLRVPTLTARTDADADVVSGDAPAGATVHVRVDGANGPATFSAVSNASGQYEARLAPTLDLVRPSNGLVYVSPTEGAEFYTTWAAVQLTVNGGNTFNSNYITGNGPTFRTVRAQLFTPDGKLIGQASGTVFGDNAFVVAPGGGARPQFFLQLRDATGAQIEMKPGDKLHVTAGDDEIELTIPPLDAVIFVQTDTVNGHTLPSAKVTLQIAGDPTGGISATADTTADAAGNFSHSFAGAWDVKYGDFILMSTAIGGHLYLNTTIAPGMLVDADQALVMASLAPNVEAVVSLKRGGKAIASRTTRADESGALMAALTDNAGEPALMQAGDVLAVTPAAPGVDPLTLTIPNLTVDADPVADAVGGRATAGGSMTMLAIDAYSREGTIGLNQAWPSVEADGTYAADFVPHVDVRPGTRVFALYRPAAGHYVVRTRTVPILNAEHSGPNACGFGEARRDVTAGLADAQSRLAATYATKARFDGFFSAALRDPAKNLWATDTNQTEMAILGGPTADIRFTTFDVAVDWQQRSITGRGPVATTFFVRPAVPCSQQAPQGVLNINVQFANPQSTGADGAFQTFIPGPAGAPGTGVELAFYAPNEHRVFRTIYRALAQVYIHADRVAGRANPLADVTVIVAAADGTERARAAVKADAEGRYQARLTDPAGKALAIGVGDVVTVQTGTETPKVTVESLSFDWSPGVSEIVGSAPAGRTVQVTVRVQNGATYTMPRSADAGGTFRLAAADVPPRADWTLANVEAVRVVLPTAGGHQIIDQTANFDAPRGPVDHAPTVYLPIGYSNRRASAARTSEQGAARDASPAARRVDGAERVIDLAAAMRGWGMMASPLRMGAAEEWARREASEQR